MSWKSLRNAGIGGTVGADVPIVSEQARQMLETTKLLIDNLARDISVQVARLPIEFREGWSQFISRVWGPFYLDHQAMGHTDILPATFEQLTQIHGQALAYRQRFIEYGGRPSTPLPAIPQPSRNADGTKVNLMWGGIFVLGIFGVGYALSHIPQNRGGSSE